MREVLRLLKKETIMRKQDFFGWLAGTIFFAIGLIGCGTETFASSSVVENKDGGVDANCVAPNFCKFLQCGKVDNGCGRTLDCGDCTFCEPWPNNVGIDGGQGFEPYDCSAGTSGQNRSYLCHFGTATMPLCAIKVDTPNYVLYCCP